MHGLGTLAFLNQQREALLQSRKRVEVTQEFGAKALDLLRQCVATCDELERTDGPFESPELTASRELLAAYDAAVERAA